MLGTAHARRSSALKRGWGLTAACGLGPLWLVAEAGRSEAATYVIYPSQDSYVALASPSMNYGALTTMDVTGGTADNRAALVQFASQPLPPDEVITGATFQVNTLNPVSAPAAYTLALHRVTANWSELTVTWDSISTNFQATPLATATAAPGATLSYDVTNVVKQVLAGTIANQGFMIRGATADAAQLHARETGATLLMPRVTVQTSLIPLLAALVSTTIESDPSNGAVNPKRIPGASIRHTTELTNRGRGVAEAVSNRIPIPVNTQLYVADLAAPASGPLVFTQGPVSSGLSYTYAGLGSTTDDLEFSSDGTTWNYTPVAGADGHDPAVRAVRVLPKGIFAGASASGNPSFKVELRVRPT